jgi:hypothetical protein
MQPTSAVEKVMKRVHFVEGTSSVIPKTSEFSTAAYVSKGDCPMSNNKRKQVVTKANVKGMAICTIDVQQERGRTRNITTMPYGHWDMNSIR